MQFYEIKQLMSKPKVELIDMIMQYQFYEKHKRAINETKQTR